MEASFVNYEFMNMVIEKDRRQSAFRAVWRTVSLWAIVFVFTTAILMAVNVAPPELKETSKFVFSTFWHRGDLKSLSIPRADGPLSTSTAKVASTTERTTVPVIKPVRVIIDKIGVNSVVINPESADIDVLDQALLRGVVRYPGSGALLDDENIFMFGHSSYLPIINNQAYKAFNRLNELNLGDEIRLFSEKSEYVFKVVKMEVASAEEAMVKFEGGKKKLILSTCDSFGKKSDRFVVEAEFVGSRSL